MRRAAGIYAKPYCPNVECDHAALAVGAADGRETSERTILSAQARRIPRDMAVWVESDTVVIDLPEALSVTDEVNGPWNKAPDGHWYKKGAAPFEVLTALV